MVPELRATSIPINTFDDKWVTKLLFNPDNSNELFIAVADPSRTGISTLSGLWLYNITLGTATQLANYSVVDGDFDPQNTLIGFLVGEDGISTGGCNGCE